MGAVSWKQVSIADRSNSAHQTKQTSFADNFREFYSHEILSRTNFWRQSQKVSFNVSRSSAPKEGLLHLLPL